MFLWNGSSPAFGSLAGRDAVNQLTSESGGGKVRITGAINKSGASVTVAGKAAAVHPQGGFAVEVDAAPGANHFPLVVTEVDGTVTTKHVDLTFDQGVPVILTYDANGNLESVAPQSSPASPTRTYQWDAADRLVGVTRHLGATEVRKTEFLYDGEGARVGKKELLNGAVESDVRYLYADTGVLQERSADGGTVLKTYTRQGELDFTSTPPTARFHTRDHLGSVQEVVAEDGTLVARYDYKPYGERVLVSGSYESAKGYTGHDYHAASGLVLTRYRAYDPGTGRWLSPDPIGESGGMNLYGYVGGDPVNAVDPLGLFDSPFTRAAAVTGLWTMGVATQTANGPMPEREFGPLDLVPDFGGAAAEATGCDALNYISPKGLASLGELGVRKLPKNPLPALDSTGELHGELPKPKDLKDYLPEDLEQLGNELKDSVRKRIEVTDKLGREKGHGQRQGAEQNLIKSIEKHWT